jgi:hypothetical protein
MSPSVEPHQNRENQILHTLNNGKEEAQGFPLFRNAYNLYWV